MRSGLFSSPIRSPEEAQEGQDGGCYWCCHDLDDADGGGGQGLCCVRGRVARARVVCVCLLVFLAVALVFYLPSIFMPPFCTHDERETACVCGARVGGCMRRRRRVDATARNAVGLHARSPFHSQPIYERTPSSVRPLSVPPVSTRYPLFHSLLHHHRPCLLPP